MGEVFMLSNLDKEQISAHGLTEDQVLNQIEIFRKGFPYVELLRPCTAGDGIERIPAGKSTDYCSRHRGETKKGRTSIFVPASGAASRMFKALETVLNRDAAHPGKILSELKRDASAAPVVEFIENLDRFAFYDALKSRMAGKGMDLEALRNQGLYVPVLEAVLGKDGLGYASLPKGLIAFHRENGRMKTPFEEHMIEASRYLKDAGCTVKMHFTVPEEFHEEIVRHIQELRGRLETGSLKYEISFSSQKPSTDTVAVDLENQPFRDSSQQLVFRPAGHGALLENLNDLKRDIVFIKNIDNILPDHLKNLSVEIQELLGGYLAEKQTMIHTLLRELARTSAENVVNEACDYIHENLGILVPAGILEEKKKWAFGILNRPIRVCGMVKNEGEPGGGPFWVKSADGRISKQIVEKSQVDMENERQREILAASTHFNPVDLVCGLRDFQGNAFDLADYVDPETGFISRKSKEGRELKALEVPGLWNGAMAFWITFFVEIPIEVFGPVKEVNDLLRAKHQAEGKA